MTDRAQNEDFRRRVTPSPGNSSIWRAQKTTDSRRKPKILQKRQIFTDWGLSPSARPYSQSLIEFKLAISRCFTFGGIRLAHAIDRSRGSGARIWVESFWGGLEDCRRKLPTNFSANPRMGSALLFLHDFTESAPPKNKFTAKMNAQSCQHPSPVSHFESTCSSLERKQKGGFVKGRFW